MNIYSILQRPLVSEKSSDLREKQNKYVFKVSKDASKHDIAKALKKIYDVDAAQIRTLVVAGKRKRRGMHIFKKPSFKKAMVVLAEGQKLPMFEDN